MMVMRFDCSDKVSDTSTDSNSVHIDQLEEQPLCQRMGIIVSFTSFDDFVMNFDILIFVSDNCQNN